MKERIMTPRNRVNKMVEVKGNYRELKEGMGNKKWKQPRTRKSQRYPQLNARIDKKNSGAHKKEESLSNVTKSSLL
jgi:hypothetical protein